MKYVIHFIGGKEMIVSEDFVINLVKPNANIFFSVTDNVIDKVVNLNNITHIERQDEEGYF
jgi:hypothetical protein